MKFEPEGSECIKKAIECPFCGDGSEKKFEVKTPPDPKSLLLFAVVCTCGARGPFSDTLEGAVDSWNRDRLWYLK